VTTPLPPRRTAELHGHAAAAATIADSFARNRPHHAWLITGPPGIGKATLAYRAARWVLAGARPSDPPLALDPAEPVFRRAAAGSHSDLLTLEREWNPRTKRISSVLTVDQVRTIGRFLSLKPGEGVFRVVVVDPADDMNAPAANALLKLLEEPPAGALLFLVSHVPGALLPTIRSRCRTLPLGPPPAAATDAWLTRHRPASTAAARARAIFAAGGAPGAALAQLDALAGDAFDAQGAVWAALKALPRGDRAAGQALAAGFARAEGEEAFQAFFRALDATLARLCAAMARGDTQTLAPEEVPLARSMAAMRPLAEWGAAWEKAREAVRLADTYNLDRRAVAWLTLQGLRPGETPYSPAEPSPVPDR
jgi:DNA polymerase-3 subunit delta'